METIYALVTKPINQNVGIIRVSGPETFFIIKKIFPNTKLIHSSVEFHKLFINNVFVDDVLILIFRSPKSFTGEDIIEIQFHGSMFISKQILNLLEKYNLRQATRGEFTRQAFLNGKVDLIQSESINQIITSTSHLIYKKSAQNLNLTQSNFLYDLWNNINYILSLIYVSIDYPENTDIPKYSYEGISQEVTQNLLKINKIIFDSFKIIKSSKGLQIALLGSTNVGKSTLLNALLKEERAIISSIPGTTRDLIRESFYLKDIQITISDTAGLRKTKDKIEKLGIKKSISTIEHSDLLFILIDSSKSIKRQEKILFETIDIKNKNIIKILTKNDKLNRNINLGIDFNNYVQISAKNWMIEPLMEKIEEFIDTKIINFEEETNAILVSDLQMNNFLKISEILKKIKKMLKNKESFDLILLELEETISIIARILGKEIDENYIENLFSNFCIGK